MPLTARVRANAIGAALRTAALCAALLAGCGDSTSPQPATGSGGGAPSGAQADRGSQASAAVISVDPALPSYRAREAISGSIKSVGSDTMNNLMAAWAETFKTFYPTVTVAVEGAGSNTAPPALVQGQAQFGPMSREMKQSEIDLFRDRFGYEPTLLQTAIDCLAVYVHRDCPLHEITLAQVAAVFGTGEPMTWGDLGVTDPAWAEKPIAVYGRNEASGTYVFFKERALGGRDFRGSVQVQQGSSGVVQAVATDPFAMGYSGIGYRTAAVRPLAISDGTGPAVEPSYGAALAGDYPLARFLYTYVNYDARAGLPPLVAEFVRVMLSREGQEAVVKDGYYPVTAGMARDDLVRVGIEPGF